MKNENNYEIFMKQNVDIFFQQLYNRKVIIKKKGVPYGVVSKNRLVK